MKAILYFLVFLIPFWGNPATHEFHVSKTLVEHNAETKSLEVSMHLFIDDLELALEKIGAKELKLGSDKENPKAEEWLVKYLNQQFQLVVNGKPVKYTFIGKELSEDFLAVWCYLEIEGITNLNSLKVTNTVLTEMFPDQKNVVQIKGPNQKKGYFLMDKANNQETLTF